MKFQGVRALASVLILFHLACVGIGPIRETNLGVMIAPVLEPYLRAVALTSTWTFFAPEPGPPPVFAEWELLDAQGKEIGTGRAPAEMKGLSYFTDRHYRHSTMTRYWVASAEMAEAMMVPYLCRSQPGVNSVQLWRSALHVPSLTDVLLGKRAIGDLVGRERQQISHNFCQRPG